jgi:hypothetical protein
MSGKTAKAQRREQEAKNQDYILRKEAMLKEVKLLSEKYRIDLVPVIHYTEQGVYPLLAFVDVKDQYEHLSEDAKQPVSDVKPNGILKAKTSLEI